MTAPAYRLFGAAVPGCHRFDLDADYDIDLRDFAVFSNVFVGD